MLVYPALYGASYFVQAYAPIALMAAASLWVAFGAKRLFDLSD